MLQVLPLPEIGSVSARREDYYPINSAASFFYLSDFEQKVIKRQLTCGDFGGFLVVMDVAHFEHLCRVSS